MFVRPFVTAGLVALLAACGSGVDVDVEKSGGTNVLVGDNDGRNVAGIGMGGKVSVVDGCLGLDDWVILWPPGTVIVDDDPLTINVQDFGPLTIGDSVDGGGLEVTAEERDATDLPSACSKHTMFYWFPNG